MKNKIIIALLTIILITEIITYFVYPEFYANIRLIVSTDYFYTILSIIIPFIGLIWMHVKYPNKKKNINNNYIYTILFAGAIYLIIVIFLKIILYFLRDGMLAGDPVLYQKLANVFTVFSTGISALSFTALFFTILMQSKQINIQSEEMKNNTKALTMQYDMLELQKDELKLQRKELALQREEMRNNTQALLDQKDEFEVTNNFYSQQEILNFFSVIIKKLDSDLSDCLYKTHDKKYAKYEAITQIAEKIRKGDSYSHRFFSGGERVAKAFMNIILFIDQFDNNKDNKELSNISVYYKIFESYLTRGTKLLILNYFINVEQWQLDIVKKYNIIKIQDFTNHMIFEIRNLLVSLFEPNNSHQTPYKMSFEYFNLMELLLFFTINEVQKVKTRTIEAEGIIKLCRFLLEQDNRNKIDNHIIVLLRLYSTDILEQVISKDSNFDKDEIAKLIHLINNYNVDSLIYILEYVNKARSSTYKFNL